MMAGGVLTCGPGLGLSATNINCATVLVWSTWNTCQVITKSDNKYQGESTPGSEVGGHQRISVNVELHKIFCSLCNISITNCLNMRYSGYTAPACHNIHYLHCKVTWRQSK